MSEYRDMYGTTQRKGKIAHHAFMTKDGPVAFCYVHRRLRFAHEGLPEGARVCMLCDWEMTGGRYPGGPNEPPWIRKHRVP